MPESGIYWGRVMHSRLSPRRHAFTYPVFTFSLDLDEIASRDRKLRLFRHNRFSLYSLRDSDHIGQPGAGIKAGVIALLRERGFAGPIDKVMMVAQFRALGHLFNPVTFYYCYDRGRAVAYVAEVNNTFRQRHCYAFFPESGPEAGSQSPSRAGSSASFRAEKVFYVSPFLDMDMTYHFRFDPLGRRLGVFIDDYQNGEAVLKTHIVGEWSPLDDRGLLLSFLKIPFMSAWILAWIHWQALKIWLKKVPQVFRPLDGMKPRALNGVGDGRRAEA